MDDSKNGANNWDVSYSTIDFFDRALSSNKNVFDYIRTNDILYTIKKTNMSVLKVVLCDQYTLGLADIHKMVQEFGEVDCIVTGGEWNGYSPEAKAFGLENKKGVFVPSEFFGSLNIDDYWNYCKRDKDGKPMYKFK